MNYLLDTHTCIWAISEKNKLSKNVKNIIQNPDYEFWVSNISLFEIAIKLKIGKLPNFEVSLPEFKESIILSGYKILDFKEEHLFGYTNFDFNEFHRDPFDRYLLSAALYENMAIITKD